MSKYDYSISCHMSEKLTNFLYGWLDENARFPEKILLRIKDRLERNNFMVALSALQEPIVERPYGIHAYVVDRIEPRVEFFFDWLLITHRGPPKAKSIINNMLRYHKLDRCRFYPPLNQIRLYKELPSPFGWSYGANHGSPWCLCLEGELESLKLEREQTLTESWRNVKFKGLI